MSPASDSSSRRLSDVHYGSLPQQNRNDPVEDIGVFATLSILSAERLPAYAVPRREDYGLDLIVQAARPTYREDSVPGGVSSSMRQVAASMIAKVTKQSARDIRLTGAVFGIQIKTSASFDPEYKTWTYSFSAQHLTYWQNCPFPVYVILCSANEETPELRWADVAGIKWNGQKTKSVSFKKVVNRAAVRSMADAAIAEIAEQRAIQWQTSLFSEDPGRQRRGLVGTQSLGLRDQDAVKLLISSLPNLHPTVRLDAMVYLVGIHNLIDELYHNVDGEVTEEDELWIHQMLGNLYELPVDIFLDILTMLRPTQSYGFGATQVRLDGGAVLNLAGDIFPDFTDGEIKRRASNWLLRVGQHVLGGPTTSISQLISLQPNPLTFMLALHASRGLKHWVSAEECANDRAAWSLFASFVASHLQDQFFEARFLRAIMPSKPAMWRSRNQYGIAKRGRKP